MRISLPYGRSSVEGVIPERTNVESVEPRKLHQSCSPQNVVKAAFVRPCASPRLSKIARHSHSAVVVTCDKTRGMPTHITLPVILEELRAGGLEADRISVLVATGLHKGETLVDVEERFGRELVQNMQITVHDSDEMDHLIDLGNLSSGTPLILNKEVIQNDLIIIEGTVEPHLFAGFTGGSKVILPGVAGTATVLRNHCWENIDDPRSRYGVINNPIRADANEALSFLKRTFAVNVVLDSEKRVVCATAGDPIASFNIAARTVADHSRVLVKQRPDIVITTNGGYPLDRNIYQCVKGIAVPERVLHEGSKIIMVGECGDGVVHEEFQKMLVGGSPDEVYQRLKTLAVPARDQWEVQVLCRILRHNPVWFVTRHELSSVVESMRMHYAPTIEQAIDSAAISAGGRVLIVPQGPSTILEAE